MANEEDNLDSTLLQRAEELFKMCDVDKKGFIDRNDFHRLKYIFNESTEVLDELFDSMDSEHYGSLNFNDMILALKKSLENDSSSNFDTSEDLTDNDEMSIDENDDSAIENDDSPPLSTIYEENEENCFREAMSCLGISYNKIQK
jgi:Ca2+-binding EF-hand superfamily protein